jgi:hypothetical protein
MLFQVCVERNPKIVKATTELYLMLTLLLNTTIVHIHTAHMRMRTWYIDSHYILYRPMLTAVYAVVLMLKTSI